MINKITNPEKKSLFTDIDWPFLFFLISVTYVKTYVKVVAIILYSVFLIFKKNKFNKQLAGPLKFYLLIPVVGLVGAVLNHSYSSKGYWFGEAFGLLQWAVSAGALYLLFVVIKNGEREKLSRTIDAFFIANILFCAYQLVKVMVASHSLMPYWLGDEKYGVSTGDQIFGMFGYNSITNCAISVLGGVYFLHVKKVKLSILCFVVMLLCTSNLSVIFSMFLLVLMLLFVRGNRKNALITVVFVAAFYPVLSFINLKYMQTIYNTFVLHKATNYEDPGKAKVLGRVQTDTVAHYDSVTKTEVKPVVIQMGYHLDVNAKDSSGYIERLRELKVLNDHHRAPNSNVVIDQDQLKRTFALIYGIPVDEAPLVIWPKPGKLYSMMQTAEFMKGGVTNLVFGAGTGNFSSKLAIRMTGLELQGKYPQKYVYANSNFVQYHLYSLFYYLCQNVALHSVINMPYSVYNQIAGEYGLVGMGLLIVLYLGYFWKNRNRSGYGVYLLLGLLLFFNVDYWFEMTSLTVVFELLMLMDIFVYKNNNADKAAIGNSINASV